MTTAEMIQAHEQMCRAEIKAYEGYAREARKLAKVAGRVAWLGPEHEEYQLRKARQYEETAAGWKARLTQGWA